VTLPLLTVREDVAGYLGTVLYVYSLIILLYLVSTIFLSFGGRVPYSRASNALLGFLRDVSEPFLGLFRRFIPPLGPLDLSPILALLTLTIGGRIVTNLIAG